MERGYWVVARILAGQFESKVIYGTMADAYRGGEPCPAPNAWTPIQCYSMHENAEGHCDHMTREEFEEILGEM